MVRRPVRGVQTGAPRKRRPLAPLIQFATFRYPGWVIIHCPIQTVVEANRSGSEDWRVRAARAKKQKKLMKEWLMAAEAKRAIEYVEFERLSPGAGSAVPDSDNYPTCFKHLRDAIAEWAGCDDSDRSGITWRYIPQRRNREHGVIVRIKVGPR